MTGPEHYKRAEHLLSGLGEIRGTMESSNASVAEMAAASAMVNGLIAEAQVHATLALAAATVVAGGLTEANNSGFDIPRYPSWAKAVQPS